MSSSVPAIELGGVEQVKEQVREARAGALLETLLQDLRAGSTWRAQQTISQVGS